LKLGIPRPDLSPRHSRDDTDTHDSTTKFASRALANACSERTVPCEQPVHADEHSAPTNPDSAAMPMTWHSSAQSTTCWEAKTMASSSLEIIGGAPANSTTVVERPSTERPPCFRQFIHLRGAERTHWILSSATAAAASKKDGTDAIKRVHGGRSTAPELWESGEERPQGAPHHHGPKHRAYCNTDSDSNTDSEVQYRLRFTKGCRHSVRMNGHVMVMWILYGDMCELP